VVVGVEGCKDFEGAWAWRVMGDVLSFIGH